MMEKDQKTLDLLALNEKEASELIEIADKYRKNFANKVKENEISNFIENLDEPTEEDIKKFADMLENIGVEIDKIDSSNNIKNLLKQQKQQIKQLNKLENELKKYSDLDIPGMDELYSFLLEIKTKHSKLVDISEDLKTATEQLKKIKQQKQKLDEKQIQKEFEVFLKNFINPAKEDIEDFIDSLEDQGLIVNKEELVHTLMEREKSFRQEKNKLSKLEMLERASENLNSNNLILQYRAIRHIRGLAEDNRGLLNWIHENHYDILEDIAEKLHQKTLAGNDAAIINEAKLSLELIEPFLTKTVHAAPGELKCKECGEDILLEWSHCASCGAAIKRDLPHYCPSCNRAVDDDWKICPECGQNLEQNYCSGCGKKLESSWKVCPFCGIKVS